MGSTRRALIATALLLAAYGSVSAIQQSPSPTVPARFDEEGPLAYVCPMHSEYTAEVEGKCPICGMTLVRTAPFDVRDYGLDVRTAPSPARPGVRTTIYLRVFHPGTGATIEHFETVHEKQYHFFVISQDMEFFQHIHPEEQSDGTWSIEVTLPKAGYYKLLSDFFPSGGAAQFIARPLVTAGFSGDLIGSRAHLVPDTMSTKTVDDVTATISMAPSTFTVGNYGHLSFHLTDTATRRPVTDLQTYLGAFGHMLIMSEDMVDYVHAHPLETVPIGNEGGPPVFAIPPGSDLEALRGGPDVTFEGLMPKPGRYRAWTQFRRDGKVHTFVFTFKVDAE